MQDHARSWDGRAVIPAHPVSWLAAVPTVLVTLLVLLVPGGVAARLVGVRGFFGLAVAPAVSVGVVAAGAVAAGLLQVRWSVLTFLVCVLLTWLVAWVVARLRRRADARRRDQVLPSSRPLEAAGWPVGLAVAAVLVTVVYLRL